MPNLLFTRYKSICGSAAQTTGDPHIPAEISHPDKYTEIMTMQGSPTVQSIKTGNSRSGWQNVRTPSELDAKFVELGHWLAGVRSFVSDETRLFSGSESGPRQPLREARLVRSALMSLSAQAIELEAALRSGDQQPPEIFQSAWPAENGTIGQLCSLLRELVLLSESQGSNGSYDPVAWSVWRRFVFRTLTEEPSVSALIEASETLAADTLPEKIRVLRDSEELPERWSSDLGIILPRIGTVMSYLRLVSGMLDRDEPLKRTILLFSRIDDLMREMMGFINSRLQRFQDDTDALFGSLDAAAYTASIELRKVHSNEFKGLLEIRPTPLVFARVETAYSLLNDSLQMTLVNFAQLLDRDVEPTDVFPDLLTKEQQSIQLRENMWHLLQIVQKTEQEPDSCPPEELKKILTAFRDKNLYFLFYKDMETVERFIEEVVITSDKKDLVPLLHRFGAYLETLLGQVNMRVVLANHPFAPLQRDPHDFPGSM